MGLAFLFVSLCVCACVLVCVCMCECVCVCVCQHVFAFACVHVHMCLHTHITASVKNTGKLLPNDPTHTQIHTHTHMHRHTLMISLKARSVECKDRGMKVLPMSNLVPWLLVTIRAFYVASVCDTLACSNLAKFVLI